MISCGKKVKKIHFLRLDPGEEIVSTIRKYLQQKNVKSGFVSYIGALKNVTLIVPGDENKVKPKQKLFPKPAEFLGHGNISTKEKKAFPHLHVMTADQDYAVRGGHLVSGTVIITGEVVVVEGDSELKREYQEKTNLWRLAP